MDISLLATRQMDRDQHKQMLVENLGIFELRALGREVGVPSPTTKKRNELIELILDRIYNNNSTYVRQSKKGRPYKKLSNLDDIMAKMTGGDDTDNIITQRKPLRYEDIVSFSQDVPVYTEVDNETEEFKGVIRKNDVVAYFLDIKTGRKVFIPQKESVIHGLQTGDLVECEAEKVNANNDFMLSELYKINGVDASKYIPRFEVKDMAIISKDRLKFGEHQLYCGRRNLLKYDTNLFEDDRFTEFAAFCKENGYKLITLGLNTCFEDQIMYSSIDNMVNMTTVYGTGYDVGFGKVVDTISLAERLFTQGEKVVLFVSDIVGLLNSLDKCFVENVLQSGHKDQGVVIVQKLVCLGKALQNGSSITIVMTYGENSTNDLFFKNELEKISSKFEN